MGWMNSEHSRDQGKRRHAGGTGFSGDIAGQAASPRATVRFP